MKRGWSWRYPCDHCGARHPSAACPALKRRAVIEPPLNGVRVTVAARLDVSAMQREMSAEQIAAVMAGIGHCVAASAPAAENQSPAPIARAHEEAEPHE